MIFQREFYRELPSKKSMCPFGQGHLSHSPSQIFHLISAEFYHLGAETYRHTEICSIETLDDWFHYFCLQFTCLILVQLYAFALSWDSLERGREERRGERTSKKAPNLTPYYLS